MTSLKELKRKHADPEAAFGGRLTIAHREAVGQFACTIEPASAGD
jgi:hypothetical protein